MFMHAWMRMKELVSQSVGLIYGAAPHQPHRGGSLWLKDDQGWFLVRNLAGIEWSAQFCADPAKVDLLRQNARRLYDLLAPEIKHQLDPTGLLDKPITDAVGVGYWTDSIFNAVVPLHPGLHTGVLPGGGEQDALDSDPEAAGVHHYPTPITDIQLFKYDDFQLWVMDEEGNPAAVVPVDARGTGNASVKVQYATPGSRLAAQVAMAARDNKQLILESDNPLARQAFKCQDQ
jgi:hypothetical protein